MNKNSLKNILTKVEVLGLDSQPIRDFIIHFQNGVVIPEDFEYIFDTLLLLIDTHKFAPHSAPPQVSILLKQLQDQLKDINKEKKTIKDNIKEETSVNINLLNMLMDIKKDLKEIKDTPSKKEVTIIKEQLHTETIHPELNPVFVPLESALTKELKGNVILEEKTGDNISSKLNKLRGRKKGA